jgi:hypothetical protein
MSDKIDELIDQAKSLGDEASLICESKELTNEDEGRRFYDVVKSRMLDVREWDKSSTASTYALFDESGNEITGRDLEIGTFIRILVHGSGKYDWVKVNHIYETPREFVITVQPSHDPTEKPLQPDVISHFFRPDSRNNFCLRRDGKKLDFYVIGINEKVNTQFTDGLLETVRNTAAANLGYYLGLQKTMWKEFCSNMIGDERS